MIFKNIQRLILSVYYYEKMHEEKRFFDAWWQFSYTLEYFFFGLCLALVNVMIGILKLNFKAPLK